MAMTSLLVPLAITAKLLLVIVHIVRTLFLHPLSRFPGPLSHSLSPIPWAYHEWRGTSHLHLASLHARYGPVVRVRPDMLSFLGASSNIDSRHLTPSDGKQSAWRDIYGTRTITRCLELYDTSKQLPKAKVINLLEGAEHQKVRMMIAPLLSPGSVRARFSSSIGRHVDKLIDRLRDASVPEKGVDMTSWLQWLTMDIGGELVLGEEFGCLDEDEGEGKGGRNLFQQLVEFGWMGNRLMCLKVCGMQWVVDWYIWWVLRKARAAANVAAKKNVEGKPVTNRNKSATAKDDQPSNKRQGDLLQNLVQDRLQETAKTQDTASSSYLLAPWIASLASLTWTPTDLHANAATLLHGAASSTSAALRSTLYLLLSHPNVLRKLEGEVRSAFAAPRSSDDASRWSYDAIHALPYLNACIDEALRRWPANPGSFPRRTEKGEMIGRWKVPKGTTVAVPIWATHLSPELFTNPRGYVPERWLAHHGEENRSGIRDEKDRLDAVQPFLVGHTDCIGRSQAKATVLLAIARLVFEFDMRLADDLGTDWCDDHAWWTYWDPKPLGVVLKPRFDTASEK